MYALKYIPTHQCISHQSPDRPRAHPADVRRQEHDGRLRPTSRTLPHCGRHVQGKDVHEGGGRADAQRPEQELLLLRRVDPQQRQDRRL